MPSLSSELRRYRPRRTAGIAALTVGLAIAAAAPGQAATDPPPVRPTDGIGVKSTPGSDKLGAPDRTLLAQARSDNDPRVTLMLATDPGQTAAVVASLRSANAWIGTVDDSLGYIRASVPTSRVERMAQLSRVDAVDLDTTIPLEKPRPGAATRTGSSPSLAPDARTPNANPYMPTQDIGSPDFTRKNPSYDGRGITIGIVDSGVDLDHPALQTTSTGAPKVVDWVTGTDPVLDGDATWRPMTTGVTAVPQFEFNGEVWLAPRSGDFTVNTFSEDITSGNDPGGDINRDGDTTDQFGILYDAGTHDIWVDANQDRTFSASELMRPFQEARQVGHFGIDDPATAVAERTPFVVEYREDVDLAALGQDGTADFVNIGLVQDSHGTHVAGIAAAHSMFGGRMNGQAPGAQLVSSRACTWNGGCTDAALLDGMIDLVVNRGVDVVNMSIGGVPALNDSNNARAAIYDRLIADYGVQLFLAGGNSGPGLNTIGDPSTASTVVSVASSISKDTWKSNYGSIASARQALHPFSSRGPSEDGDSKPNLAAPGSAISTVPLWYSAAQITEVGYQLPVGYAMFNGTSMASPQAAGAAALLLSGARQRDISVTPKRLRDAMYSSAELIKGEPVVAQGAGLIDVPGAWNLLTRRERQPVATYTVDAPVCTLLADQLRVPGRGPGVHNRCAPDNGGQVLGQSSTYDVTVTRTGADERATRHTVTIVGDEAKTFSAPRTISLAAGQPAVLPLTAKAKQPGLHSAMVEIDDPRTPVIDHRFMATVVQTVQLPEPSRSATVKGSVERNRSTSYFVTVPDGTTSMQVDLSGIAQGSQTRFTTVNPYGVAIESGSSLVCFTNFEGGNGCEPSSRAYSTPTPGVWEIIVEARRTSPVLKNPFTLTATMQSISLDPAEQVVTADDATSPIPVQWSVTNRTAPISVRTVGSGVTSGRAEVVTISQGERREISIDVPADTPSLTATIAGASDPEADIDLAVFGPDGQRVGSSLGGGSFEFVSVDQPVAGRYTAVLTGTSVPAGSTQVGYSDQYASASLGSLEMSPSSFDLATGQTLTLTGTLRPSGASVAGRSLFAQLILVNDVGGTLAQALVTVEVPPNPVD